MAAWYNVPDSMFLRILGIAPAPELEDFKPELKEEKAYEAYPPTPEVIKEKEMTQNPDGYNEFRDDDIDRYMDAVNESGELYEDDDPEFTILEGGPIEDFDETVARYRQQVAGELSQNISDFLSAGGRVEDILRMIMENF